MGVSGCGKSTLGERLAAALHCRFVEGDTLHPPDNVARMAAGTPLDDDDRAGWLASIAALLADSAARGEGLVVSCSALKRSYRDRLRDGCPGLRLVHLHGDPSLLARRMATREGHYMPPALLDSQLATLELPAADEGAITLDIADPLPALLAAALARLDSAAPHGPAPGGATFPLPPQTR